MQSGQFKFQIFEVSHWDDFAPQSHLGPNDIHIWRVSKVPEKSIGSLNVCISLFRHYLGSNYSISRNENGKPIAYLNGSVEHEIQFNISHTKSIFVIAFVAAHYIGIDIEDIGTKRPWKSLAERFFAPQEVQQLHAADESKQLDLFFQLWTLKEAMIKCLGISIFTGIGRAHFFIEKNNIKLMSPTSEDQALRFFYHKDSHYFSMALTPRA